MDKTMRMTAAEYKISPNQEKWIKNLNHHGYAAAVCFGWEEAWELIHAYITEKNITVRRYIERGFVNDN